MATKAYESWGRYPRAEPRRVEPVYWRSAPPVLRSFDAPVLAYGQGRTYGDVCLNADGVLLDTAPLSRFIAFDAAQGLLSCEAGATLDDVLRLIVPHGWFVPVTPGTKFVSVGGAIANDVHGKNHHVAGTFGRHVTRFELLRSTGERLICSPDENRSLYEATIGGLGLTGLILWAEVKLKRIPGPGIEGDRIRFGSLAEFFALSKESDRTHEYTVAWVDSLAKKRHFGRGVFIRGNHAPLSVPSSADRRRIRIPFNAPAPVLNRWSIKAFNALYWRRPSAQQSDEVVHYDPFFYPLDAVLNWNRMYGRRGLLQFQCVVPFESGHEAIQGILARIVDSGRASFLAVLKTFGDVPSPGVLSFPRPGVTLALDFPIHPETLGLVGALNEMVAEAGGAVYPAKDACMSATQFQTYFPRWQTFARLADPAFSSSFWRRVTGPRAGHGGEE